MFVEAVTNSFPNLSGQPETKINVADGW